MSKEIKGYQLTHRFHRSEYHTWLCQECGEEGAAANWNDCSEKLFAHMKQHKIDSYYEECTNYFGE